jgi:poly-gamma-glutamate synthesis protein (capsule biosynthesis protein)
MKITFLGDIMCEPCVLKAGKQADGSYDFSFLFEKVKPMLAEADFVISNLEFPMAGEDNGGYTNTYYVFNAPDAFARDTKNAGVDLISTINNHTLDRGPAGMLRTLEVLDEAGLPHTGSFDPKKGREEAYYFERGGVKFAVVAYTYTTNKKIPEDHECFPMMNLLRPLKWPTYTPEVNKAMKTWVDKVFKKLKGEHKCTIRRLVGLPATLPRADDYIDEATCQPYIQQFQNDIRLAKEKADFVIFYPHVGGQFNPKPGKFSEYVVKKALEAGADAILASHSHMVQKAEIVNGVPCAWSLGNFSMSPNSSIIADEMLPGYGLAMHLYFEGKTVVKTTVSILKAVEKRGKQLVSWPIDELYETLTAKEQKKLEADVQKVLGWAFDGKYDGPTIQREYEVK